MTFLEAACRGWRGAMKGPIPPPGHVPPVDSDGYPRVCCVCGERVLRTGSRAIEYRTVVDVKGRVVEKTSRHFDCKP